MRNSAANVLQYTIGYHVLYFPLIFVIYFEMGCCLRDDEFPNSNSVGPKLPERKRCFSPKEKLPINTGPAPIMALTSKSNGTESISEKHTHIDRTA